MLWRTTNLPRLIRWATTRLATGRARPAALARPRPGVRPARLAASALAPVGLLAVVVLATTSPATAQSDGEPTLAELVPDVTLLVDGAVAEPGELIVDLEAIDGVRSAVIDGGTGADTLVHLSLDESPSTRRPLDAVVDQATEILAEVPAALGADETIEVGGAAAVDRALADRFATSARWLALLGVAIGGVIGWFDGWRRAAALAAGLGLAVLAGTAIGGQAAGSFEGSVAGTALPGALAALVLGTALTARLLIWFRRPSDADGAARLQEAVEALGTELALLVVGLVAVTLVVEPLDAGRSALTGATVGAAVAAVVVLAVVGPALALIERPHVPAPGGPLPLTAPDGRDLPLPVVGLAAAALAILSVAAFGRVGGDLLDLGDLDDTGPEAVVAEAQARRGGDPTQALVADAVGASATDFAGWAAAAAERSEVAWIDIGLQRFTAAGIAELDPSAAPMADAPDDLALVVPAVSTRSGEGQLIAERILDVPLAGDGPRLSGEGAVAAEVAGSRSTVLIAIVGLAIVTGLATAIITGNRALALISALLRLLTGGAAVGLLNLVSAAPSMGTALTLLVVTTIGGWLAELELLRRLEAEHEYRTPGQAEVDLATGAGPPGPADATPGQYGLVGLAGLASGGLVVALVALGGGGPGTGRLGLSLLLAVLIEIGVAALVLRPALLGQRAAYQTAVRPLRIAAHGRSTGDPDAETAPDDDPAWREIVSDLVETEFWLQAEPDRAELDAIFEPGTPVHRQAAERHGNLVSSGLRVVGRSPELQSLRTVRERQPVVLTVTVDHPASQLLDQTGRVVGVRRPERRVGRLWLAPGPGGSHRIAESIELGSTPLDGAGTSDEPAETGHGTGAPLMAGDTAIGETTVEVDLDGLDPDRQPSAG